MTRIYTYILDRLESPALLKRDQLAFLPAALEVQETPPSPIGRAIVWTIVLLFIITVLWAALGTIDVVAVATGKVIPSDRVKVIQPLDKGTVIAIHVKEDQLVNAGDPLVELDMTSTAADEKRLANELREARMGWLRSEAFRTILAMKDPAETDDFLLIDETAQALGLALNKSDKLLQSQFLRSERLEYQSKVGTLEGQYQARIGERAQAQALKHKLERTLPLITERAASVKTLYDKKMVSREQYLALEQERITQEQDLVAEAARVRELTGEIHSVESQKAGMQSEYSSNNLRTYIDIRQQAASLEQEYLKAKQRSSEQVLHSPITGYVKRLNIHTIGGVVTPAQELMEIVPKDAGLEVEAYIQNKDIGFVEEGQSAEVKVDTFNFTKYGTIDAELKSISNDAVTDENLGLIYPAGVLLKSSKILVNGRWVSLSPGMAVTVEVKTGKRRIIEYFLSPLLRYKQESIRER